MAILSVYDIFLALNELKPKLEHYASRIGDYVVAAVMTDNEQAIPMQIDSMHQGYAVAWTPHSTKKYTQDQISWSFPLNWTFYYPIPKVEGNDYGYLVVMGSLTTDHKIFDVLLARIILMLVFISINLILLYPLASRIPKKIFLEPIHSLINLLETGQINHSQSSSLAPEIIEIERKINILLHQAKEYEKNKNRIAIELGVMIAQVAHDIRSPLSALNSCLKSLPQIPEKERILLRNAANRINDIANNLLQQHRGGSGSRESYRLWLLAPLVESIISEKRVQFDHRLVELDSEISSAGFAAFALFDATEMKRLLSNLINNASEAFDEKGGKITVVLDADEYHLFLTVKDNGCGIPPDKLASVLEPGVSLKEKGNGIGLTHAKKTLEGWGGCLALSSVLGAGTEVKLTLVRSQTPAWFVSSIEVSEGVPIAILDDDASVHDAWDQRLQKVSGKLHVHHFKSAQGFIDWYTQHKELDSEASLRKSQNDEVMVFSDYELLGDPLSGLDALEEVDCGKNALLVTSHYENHEIMERCQKRGIRLLPKNLLAHVEIRRQEIEDGGAAKEAAQVSKLEGLFAALQKEKGTGALAVVSNEKKGSDLEPDNRPIDAVFIDDDPYNHEFWLWSAKKAKKSLVCFTDLASFEAIEETLPKTTAIYIDLNLANKVRGLDVAKILHVRRFTNLHIATGYADFKKTDYPFLVSIIDKTPPF